MSLTTAQLPGEGLDHDAQLMLLSLKPLPDTASADEFSDRVSTAIDKHFPYLERTNALSRTTRGTGRLGAQRRRVPRQV